MHFDHFVEFGSSWRYDLARCLINGRKKAACATIIDHALATPDLDEAGYCMYLFIIEVGGITNRVNTLRVKLRDSRVLIDELLEHARARLQKHLKSCSHLIICSGRNLFPDAVPTRCRNRLNHILIMARNELAEPFKVRLTFDLDHFPFEIISKDLVGLHLIHEHHACRIAIVEPGTQYRTL